MFKFFYNQRYREKPIGRPGGASRMSFTQEEYKVTGRWLLFGQRLLIVFCLSRLNECFFNWVYSSKVLWTRTKIIIYLSLFHAKHNQNPSWGTRDAYLEFLQVHHPCTTSYPSTVEGVVPLIFLTSQPIPAWWSRHNQTCLRRSRHTAYEQYIYKRCCDKLA